MNEQERDELLVRVDERVRGMKEDDIPDIKNRLDNHGKRIRIIEIIIAGITVSGGGALGIIKLLE